MSKHLLCHNRDPDKLRMLVLALTGVATVNFNCTTIHSGLNIRCHGKLYPLNDRNRSLLRNKYSEIQLVIIEEISMVSSKLLLQVHQHLLEIFGGATYMPFAVKPITPPPPLVDLNQFPYLMK